ncbi:MAG: hypothetical protein N2114_01010 [Candidatus Goldbacteria bacterium]|nr:hypothetical protein [Candidatus Goldiibacteriota bacterium]
MKKSIFYMIIFFTSLFFVSESHSSTTIVRHAVEEAVEIAAKVSGKGLSPVTRKIAIEELEKWTVKYGDDALRATKHGGLELLDAASKYGDDVWHFSSKVPQATRALAVRADELMPLTRRIGTEVLELESKKPGITEKIVEHFGDDGVKYLARNASPDDLTKLTGYAAKADSEATKALLYEKYKEGGTHFLEQLDYKKIMAGGLSIGIITAAYQLSKGEREKSNEVGKGIGKGYEEAAKKEPAKFIKSVKPSSLSDIFDAIYWIVFLFGGGLAISILIKINSVINKKRGVK